MGVALPKFLDVKLYLLYNLRGLLGPWPHPLFEKKFKGHGNMPAKFELRSLNHVGKLRSLNHVGIISTYFPKI